MRLEVPDRAEERLGARRGNTGSSSRQPEHQVVVGSTFFVGLVAGRKRGGLPGLNIFRKGLKA